MACQDSEMYVTKRNGELEIVSFDKILVRIKKVGKEVNIKINYTGLTMKVIDQIYDKISTTKIDELTAEQCASMSSVHPDYNILAGRIIVSNHHKNTSDSFSQVMDELYHFRDAQQKHYPLISPELRDAIQTLGPDKLNALCDYSRDYLIDYFGFKTLEKSYLFKINKKTVERPQHMWLRVALGIHGANWELVEETYTYLSNKYFTHATPTLFNAGTPHPQLSSCYLMAMEEDSIDGIFNTLKDCALISKWAGGIGLHIHNVRASGSLIRGTNGSSNGIVHMLKVLNKTAKNVDQGGGKRNGSFAIYLEPWHADLEMFLQMRKNHGDEELKARDLFYALWIPDLFMERVKTNQTWTFMCPSECPGLSDVYGVEFVELYERYEREKRGRSISARNLWFQILDAQMETGTPYLLYKDAANQKSNQKNVGTIKSSNLCVAPETTVLTDEGQFPIYSLWEGNNSHNPSKDYSVNVWNGQEFSRVKIEKTGENQPLMKVFTSDGSSLTCTPYHKFWIEGKLIEARDLKPGHQIDSCDFPIINGSEEWLFGMSGMEKGNESGRKNLNLKKRFGPIFVPINYSLASKMEWLAGFLEPYVHHWVNNPLPITEEQYISRKNNDYGVYLQSHSHYFLRDIKLMLQTCGINPFISFIDSEMDSFAELFLSVSDLQNLMNIGLFFTDTELNNFVLQQSANTYKSVTITKIMDLERIDDTYCFTEDKKHSGIFNGILTSQCTEIMEYSDENETAVCNLASLALPSFMKDSVFDYEKLHHVTKVVTNNLNKIIDVNYYPTPKTKISNMRHRPIGIGIQGLADVFLQLGIAFYSEEAKQINKDIFETIYHAAMEKSCEIAQIEGYYETFPGSPTSKGIFQFDMWNVAPTERYNWDELKKKVMEHGIRNSLLLAPMPTASTSQILGFNECIEPITSNIYSRRTLAGEFVLVNKYLMYDLIALDMWNDTLKNNMIANNGSIQHIETIPQIIRDKYRTVWEIPMRHLIDMAADRGAYICQSQSLNLWLEDPNYNSLTSMHFYAWQKGLKTGIYYLRRRPKHQAQQFTIEPEKSVHTSTEEICEMCSS